MTGWIFAVLLSAGEARALPAGIAGDWIVSTPEAQIRAQQEAAMQRALASLPSMLHGVAGTLIRPAFFYCATYRLTVDKAVDGDAFTTSCDGRPPLALSVGGSRSVTYDNQPFTAALSGGDSEVLLSLSGSNGTRTTRYLPVAGGLRVEVSVESPRLAEALRWVIDYRRA